jgi:hypothetical protein
MQEAPIGGMMAGTLVLTMEGPLPVEYLGLGDRVVTRHGAIRVTGVEITVVQNARVVLIAHDTLGIDTPHDDVTVAAAQTIAVRGWRAKALCGTEQALVAASRLTDGEFIKAETLSEARLFKLTFAEPTIIYAGGLMLACDKTSVSA